MKKAEAMLSCKNLSFRYTAGEDPVFSDLSLTVKHGEAVLLMGPSGCGKSTLAYCLAGLYPEYSGKMEGEILFDGEPLSEMGPAGRARSVSIMFQNPDDQFCMDRADHEVLFALENVNYQGDMGARMQELLSLVDLSAQAKSPIHTLSGGMKQKLALATALATGAKMLILDEPFACLDPSSCASLTELLGRMNSQGLTLFIVDHRADWWRSFITRVVIMEPEGDLDKCSMAPEQMEESRDKFTQKGLFLDDSIFACRHAPKLPQDPEFMVQARNLTLFHGKRPFLEGLSFNMKKGSVTAIVGRCGCGKTTLLHALGGIGRIHGELTVNGSVGLVFQNPRFQFLTLKVEDEVFISLKAAYPQRSENELIRETHDLLREFGLLSYRDQSPYTLSQGEQRRLALLSMLSGDRSLMLLDEPTYAQDERSTAFILDLLEKRVAEGLTVIMATHDISLAKNCANNIFLLEDGKLTNEKP